MFEMDLWWLLSYLDGYRTRMVYDRIRDIKLAWDIGMYSGQYQTGKKAKDPNIEVKELMSKIEPESKSESKNTKEDFDKQIIMFNKARKSILSRTK